MAHPAFKWVASGYCIYTDLHCKDGLQKSGRSRTQFYSDLIKIAIYEKDIDEALKLYDTDNKSRSKYPFQFGHDLDDIITEAVKDKYPHLIILNSYLNYLKVYSPLAKSDYISLKVEQVVVHENQSVKRFSISFFLNFFILPNLAILRIVDFFESIRTDSLITRYL